MPGQEVLELVELDLYEYRSTVGDRNLDDALRFYHPDVRSGFRQSLDLAYGDLVDVSSSPNQILLYEVVTETSELVVAEACVLFRPRFETVDGYPAGPPGTEFRRASRYEFRPFADGLLLYSVDATGDC